MNIKDFNIGDKVLCVNYTRRNDPRFMNAVVDSVGDKYVRCNICGNYHKFKASSGVYSEHYLISSKDNLLYLFKNHATYEDYLEHMELNRQLSDLTNKSLTLNQLRYALETLYKQFPKKPAKTTIDDVGRCPTCNSMIHKYDSTYFGCVAAYCKWCGQALNWYEPDSEDVSDAEG